MICVKQLYIIFKENFVGEISGSHAYECEDDSLLEAAPYNLVEVNQSFRGASCPDDGGSKHLLNVGNLLL
jgi:hypothetical protein